MMNYYHLVYITHKKRIFLYNKVYQNVENAVMAVNAFMQKTGEFKKIKLNRRRSKTHMAVQLNKSVFSPYIFKYIYIYIFLTKNLIKVSFINNECFVFLKLF